VIKDNKLTNGNFMQPMVLEKIPIDSPAYREELFGPVFSLFKVKNNKDAVKLANDSVYGLGGSVFSKDVEEAKKVAEEIDAGSVFINETVMSDSKIPAGGVKDSGHGREGGKDGLEEMSLKKSIVIGN
jgi:succinate-semialdehyde dehydrogenase/glutarate-semialdehyde dehydrogenase